MLRLTNPQIETLAREACLAGDTVRLALCAVALGQTITPHQQHALLAAHRDLAAQPYREDSAEWARDELRRIWVSTEPA